MTKHGVSFIVDCEDGGLINVTVQAETGIGVFAFHTYTDAIALIDGLLRCQSFEIAPLMVNGATTIDLDHTERLQSQRMQQQNENRHVPKSFAPIYPEEENFYNKPTAKTPTPTPRRPIQ